MSIRPVAAFFYFLAGAASTLAAIPGIDSIQVERKGADYVIRWTPPAAPVDGYRVYRSRRIDCAQPQLVYEGAAPSFTEVGAFDDVQHALYRISAFAGAEEGPLTTAIYKFRVPNFFLPGSGRLCGAIIATPPQVGVTNDVGLCLWIKGQSLTEIPRPDDHPNRICRLMPDVGQEFSHFCDLISSVFDLAPGEAHQGCWYLADPPVMMWGHGHPSWSFTFTIVRSADRTKGQYHVSLPYDHAYPDLAAVAADVPGAVEVTWLDAVAGAFVGLARDSSADLWTGTNVPLDDKRGQGLQIAVDTPGTWSPQRVCGRSIPPGAVGRLTAVRRGRDVRLEWAVSGEATGMYRVYRPEDRRRLLVPAAEPVYLQVAGPSPAFPVEDAGAVGTPASLFYQVAAETGDGVLGGF